MIGPQVLGALQKRFEQRDRRVRELHDQLWEVQTPEAFAAFNAARVAALRAFGVYDRALQSVGFKFVAFDSDERRLRWRVASAAGSHRPPAGRRTAPRRRAFRRAHRARHAAAGGTPGDDDGPSSADPPLALPAALAALVIVAAALVGWLAGAGAALVLPAFGLALAGRLLTEREAAEALRMSTRTLRRYRAEGLVGFVQFGRRIFYRPDEVEALPAKFYIPPKGGR